MMSDLEADDFPIRLANVVSSGVIIDYAILGSVVAKTVQIVLQISWSPNWVALREFLLINNIQSILRRSFEIAYMMSRLFHNRIDVEIFFLVLFV